jgi:hypothetical protein
MPIQGDTKLTFALERPGASADGGVYAGRIELQGVSPRFPLPDFSAEYRYGKKWGYFELAGILRDIQWVDQNTDQYNLSGGVTGWGLNFSTNLHLGKNDIFRGSYLYGEGVENYMNDAPVDVGIKHAELTVNPLAGAAVPVKGVALPVQGIVAFLDHTWSPKFSTSLGYSQVKITNSNAQLPSDFRQGNYALINLLYYPVKNMMAGVEFEWGDRHNYTDGFTSNISKLQFSFRYNYSQAFYKK